MTGDIYPSIQCCLLYSYGQGVCLMFVSSSRSRIEKRNSGGASSGCDSGRYGMVQNFNCIRTMNFSNISTHTHSSLETSGID